MDFLTYSNFPFAPYSCTNRWYTGCSFKTSCISAYAKRTRGYELHIPKPALYLQNGEILNKSINMPKHPPPSMQIVLAGTLPPKLSLPWGAGKALVTGADSSADEPTTSATKDQKCWWWHEACGWEQGISNHLAA